MKFVKSSAMQLSALKTIEKQKCSSRWKISRTMRHEILKILGYFVWDGPMWNDLLWITHTDFYINNMWFLNPVLSVITVCNHNHRISFWPDQWSLSTTPFLRVCSWMMDYYRNFAPISERKKLHHTELTVASKHFHSWNIWIYEQTLSHIVPFLLKIALHLVQGLSRELFFTEIRIFDISILNFVFCIIFLIFL